MKKRLLVLLVVLALFAVSGLHLAAAQSDTTLQAVTLKDVSLVSGPSETADAVVDVPANTVVTLMGADASGAWLQVETADGDTGYGPKESFLILNPPLLGQLSQVSNPRTSSDAGIFATPNFASDIVTTLPQGTVVSVLGTSGEWAYVKTADGTTGWSIGSQFAALPADAQLAQVSVSSDNLGVFTEPKITSDVAEALPNGSFAYIYGAEKEWVQVIAPDGVTGYAVAASFTPVPTTMVDTSVNNAQAGIYKEAKQTADIITTLGDGVAVHFVADVDPYWIEVMDPSFGDGFGLKVNFGAPYYLAEVKVNASNVRSLPNESTGNVITILPAGTKVLVKGKSADGLWVNVVIPFSEITQPWEGVNGWMRDFLFQSGDTSTLNMDILGVTE